MRITYIVTPVADSLHLIRCLNAIIRQNQHEDEIIISAIEKKSLTRHVEDYLASQPAIKITVVDTVNRVDSILEAIQQASGEYIVFIDPETVATPVASSCLRSFSDARIIYLAESCSKIGGSYSLISPYNGLTFPEAEKKPDWKWFMYKKDVLEQYGELLLRQNDAVSWIRDIYWCREDRLHQTEKACFYFGTEGSGNDLNIEDKLVLFKELTMQASEGISVLTGNILTARTKELIKDLEADAVMDDVRAGIYQALREGIDREGQYLINGVIDEDYTNYSSSIAVQVCLLLQSPALTQAQKKELYAHFSELLKKSSNEPERRR